MGQWIDDYYYKLHALGRDICLSCPLPECVYVTEDDGPPANEKDCPLVAVEEDVPANGKHNSRSLEALRTIEGLLKHKCPLTVAEVSDVTGLHPTQITGYYIRPGRVVAHKGPGVRGPHIWYITAVNL